MTTNSVRQADIKPCLKWAGGKTQLLPAIEAKLIQQLQNKKSISLMCEGS